MVKVKNWNWRKFYIVMLFIMAVLVAGSFFLVKTHVYNPAQENGMKQVAPVSHEETTDGTDIYTFEFARLTPSTRNLLFNTNHQEVRVYMNKKMVYSTTKADSPFGHTTGAVWNQVDLPEREGQVQVMIKPVYASKRQSNCTFYQGNGVAMGNELLRSSFPAMLMCICIIMIGICMLCFWSFSGIHHKWMADMFHMGMLVCFMGVWSLGETQGFIYAVQNRVASSYLAYTYLMAIGILFVMFIHRFMNLHDIIPYRTLLTYGLLESVTCQILQFLNIRDMKETIILTHIMLIASVIYMLYGICMNLYLHCYVRRTIVNLIGFVVILITMSMDMYTYYDNRVNANQAGKFGILIYILMVGTETVREIRQHKEEEEHLQMYQEMAMKDMLTGCYNRNAYDEQVEHAADVKRLQVVAFDLNNLKHCNDTYGHQCGDKYLCDSASVIRKVYSKYGRVYRIGGDEFCVVTQGLSMKRLNELRLKLEQAEREYNQRKPEIQIAIACGCAMYDEKTDKTIEDIRMRADERMYEDKKDLKAKSDRIRRVL